MNKLLLMSILVNTGSLYGMESEKQSDQIINQPHCATIQSLESGSSSISLPLIYHYLRNLLSPDVAYHIFSFHYDGIDLAKLQGMLAEKCTHTLSFVLSVGVILDLCGYGLATELCKRYFLHGQKSICDIKDHNDWTVLHRCAFNNNNVVQAGILLKVAGNNIWSLLTAQDKDGWTALHRAVFHNHAEIVKLILNTAANNALMLLAMKNDNGNTALHVAAFFNSLESFKVLLDAAGNNARTLLAMKNTYDETVFDRADWQVKIYINNYLQSN